MDTDYYERHGRLNGLIDALRITSTYMDEMVGRPAAFDAVKVLHGRLAAKYDEMEQATRPRTEVTQES